MPRKKSKRPRRAVRVYKSRVVVDVNRLEMFLREYESRWTDLFLRMAEAIAAYPDLFDKQFSDSDQIDAELATDLLFDLFDGHVPDGRPDALSAVMYDPHTGELTIHEPELPPHLDPPEPSTAPPGMFPVHLRLLAESDARN